MFISQIIGASTTHMNHSLHIIHRPNSEVGSLGSAYFASLGMPRFFAIDRLNAAPVEGPWEDHEKDQQRRSGPLCFVVFTATSGRTFCNRWRLFCLHENLPGSAPHFQIQAPFGLLFILTRTISNLFLLNLIQYPFCELTTLVLNKLAFKKAWFSCLLALPHVALNNPLFFANSSYVRFRFVLKYNPF